MTDDDEGLGPYPEWKQAADRFLASGKGPGDLLEFPWLYEAFGMVDPNTAATVPEFKKAQLRFLNIFDLFKDWLLEEQLLALRSRAGIGYEIVRPAEQAQWAAEHLHNEMRKEFRRAAKRLAYTQVDQLTDRERQEHVDVMANIGRMKAAMRPPRQIKASGA